MVSLANHLIKLDRLTLHCFHWILINMIIKTCVLSLLLCIVTTNGNSHDGPSPFEHETLSPRSVNTKYGALRGFVIYFKNIDRSGFPGSRPFPSSSSSPSSPPSPGSSSNLSSSSPTTTTTSSSTSSSASSYSSTSSTSSTFTSSKSNLASMTPVEVFLGVPYATPPIGSLRFMPPVTPTHWRGVKLSNRLGPVCPQKLPDITLKQCKCNDGESKGHRSNANNSNNVNSNNSGQSSPNSSFDLPEGRSAHLKRLLPYLRKQSEDCLYLNIFVPFAQNGPSNVNSKLPVLVFIHGESYDWGTGNLYDGSILSSFGNVIVVTLNYRLGVFGFLPAIQDGTIRGNYGLMDQVAALHWIQENINEFGGNPSNITIMGHGHGAACVNLLMISPMATDLFNRVILMSGSALAPWAIATDSDIYSRHLAKLLNCPNHDNLVMVNCLRSKTAEEILRVDLKVPQHLSAFGPIVDGIVVISHPKEFVSKSYDYSSSSSSAFSHFYSPMFPSSSSIPYSLPLSSSSSSASSSLPTSSSSSNAFSFDNQGYNSPSTTYDLLFGITRVESPYLFTAHEERHGIDMRRRDRVLRTLVRNLFDFHQQVILLTLINEYTDWSRPVEHPINLFDSLVDILGDALVVSPLIQTGDTNARLTMSTYSASQVASSRRHHHPVNSMGSSRSSTSPSSTLPSSSSNLQSSSSPAAQPSTVNLSGSTGSAKDRPDHHTFGSRTFFYLFSHQSENSGFSPRLGCQHGEELSYIFGAPLASTLLGNPLSIFHTNYTRQEATLAEAVMTYWTNFVKFGDPNIWPNELDSHGDRTKGRFENVFWPQYDTITRKYLLIGMKPKVRDHYHSHRLSYWLHLVPRLQETSFNEEPIYYYKHHLLPDHESPDSYDGIVRQISLRFHPTSPASSSTSNSSELNHQIESNFNSSTRGDWKFLSSNKLSNDSIKLNRDSSSKPTNGKFDETDGKTLSSSSPSPSSSSSLSSLTTNSNKTQATPIIMEQNNYSTALSVTIAIGCSLLILNMLIFAGVYYQLDKAKSNRSKSCSHLDSSNDNITSNSANNSNSGHQQHHHHLHHSHHAISSSTNSTSLTNVNNSNNNNSTLVDASVNGQQHHPLLHHHHHHHSDYHNKFEEGLTKDETPLLTNRSSYIIQDCGESKPDDELDLTRSTGNTDLGMTLDEDKYLQQEQLQQQDRTYQTHYLTNVNLNDSITDLNRLKSDCAKVLITNYDPRDSTTSNASTISGNGGNTLRRSPKSVLKKSSMDEPVMSVFHYSPSHHHSGCPSSTCCTSECTISTAVPTNPSIQASSIPGYVTLGRQGTHHTYHSQHPSIVYNHRALTQSELMNKGSNLMGRCEEETTA